MANESNDPGPQNEAVWVIEETHHSRDLDNYEVSRSSIEIDEGFYLSKIAAEARANERNAPLVARYGHAEQQRQLEYKRKSKAIMRHNSEAAAIRAAGMQKADMALPRPFVPRTLAEFRRNNDHVIYEVVEVQRATDDASEPLTSTPSVAAR